MRLPALRIGLDAATTPRKTTPCKQCGAQVQWVKNDGRWQCHNPDGSDHWDRCSQLRFERIKREGEYFERKGTKGYHTNLKRSGVQYTQQTSGLIRGEREVRHAGNCSNCVPPWEVCPNSCPIALGGAA